MPRNFVSDRFLSTSVFLCLSLSLPWKVDSCTIANWRQYTFVSSSSLWFIGVPRTSPLATTGDGPLGIKYNANPLQFPIAGKRDDSKFPHVRPLLTMQIRIDYNRYRWYVGKQIYPIPRMRARDARLYIYVRESIVDVNFQSIACYIPSEYTYGNVAAVNNRRHIEWPRLDILD